MNWPRNLKREIKLSEPLKNKTTFKIGGRAKFFYRPKNIIDLKQAVLFAKKEGLKIFVIGAGSNILVSDKVVNGLILRLNSPFFKKVSFAGNQIIADAGVMLGSLIQGAKQKGLSGLEFLAGIPGTLGGALMMNAGAWGKDIGGLTESVKVIDPNGKARDLSGKDIKFAYRDSGLEKYIILSARLKLSKKSKEEIQYSLNKYLRARRSSQDTAFPNAGCVFKNPDGESAGKLIDLCGLKGKKIGGAFISNKHANFILNKKNALSRDVLSLMEFARRTVKNKFKINLQPEIKIWR